MNQFKPSVLTLALFAAGLTMTAPFGGIAHAQEQQVENEQDANADKTKKEEEKVEAIQVRGFRGSVIKSLNTKRYSDTVVDAISADDIGGLPDVSIADSLTRMPGITSVRIDGQSSELNIRGLSGVFVFSTLNGREMVSNSGGRAVQFDQYPSELIEQAMIYKSQKASLIEGGVAGTIELQTANALDNDEDEMIRLSAHGNWNEAAADNADSGSIGHRLTASYQAKLLDDTVGLSIGYARMFQPTVSSRFVNYQFDERNLSDDYDGAPESLLVSSGFELNERGGEDTRNAFVVALNWQANERWHFQSDIFYSDYESLKWDRGLRVSGLNNIDGGALTLTNPIISNGALIGGTFSRDPDNLSPSATLQRSDVFNMNIQTQADDNSTDSSVFSAGIKADWDATDRLTMHFDYSHAQAEETYHDRVVRMSMFEDASAATPLAEDNLVMTYHLNSLGVPTVSFNQDFTDLNKMMVTSAEAYPHIEENSSDSFRIDLNYELDNPYFSSFESGVRISNREYELDRGRFVYGTTDYRMRNGQYITYDADGNEVVRYQPFQLTEDMVTVTGIGGDLSTMPAFLAIDNAQVLDSWIPGVDQSPVKLWAHNWTMTQNNVVEEDVTAAYFQGNISTEMFGKPLSGNIGVRIVHTKQAATGLLFMGKDRGDAIADEVGVVNNDYILGTDGVSYTDVLPSINLNFSLTENDQLRFAYSKAMARPELPKMANSGSFDFVSSEEGYMINLNSSTSPKLRPFYVQQFDLSYEHYLEDGNGALSVAVWYKDIQNMVAENAEKNFDYAAAGIDVPNPPDSKLYDDQGELINWQNGTYRHADNVADAGYLRGFELAYTQTFDFLPDLWKGLGFNLNYSYTKSEILVPSKVPGEVGQPGPLEGLSPRVYSATLFYDYDEKFNARISARYREAYLSRQIAIGSDQSAYFNEETIYSAQMSYNFTDNLQAVVSMDNLTDEPNISYFGDTSRTGTIQYFGRTLYFGVNYKM